MPDCHFCGAPLSLPDVVGRDMECESCRRDVRCCINCRHYDVRYDNSCRETEADLVEDKDRRNFCEYFAFNPAPYVPAGSTARADEARAKLEGLFRNPPGMPTRKPATARDKLDSLFGGPGPPPRPDDPKAPPAPSLGDRASDARRKLENLFKKPDADR